MEYRLLGPVEVVAPDGRPLPVHGAKLRGLVALLALEAGRVVSADRLIDALYEDPPPRVENAVQQLVSKLRRIMADAGAPNRVGTRAPGYRLDEPADGVDALRFERLVQAARGAAEGGDAATAARLVTEALGLWRGDPLAGAGLVGQAAGIRTRMAELAEGALDDRIDWELRLGRHAALVAELEALVVATPLRERRWGQLMVALYRSGRQSDALSAYQQARRMLADELGIAPGPQLRQLEAAVLAHDESLAVPRESAPRRPPTVPDPPDRAIRSGQIRRPRTACLGRETELGQLTELVDRPGLTTLVGPGGVGKSRLAVEVAELLDRRLRDGARWVELTPVTAGGVGEAVGHAIGFDGATLSGHGVDLLDELGRSLGCRRIAVVLDNCEHLIDEVAWFVARLLDRAPELWVVATSREGLGIPGEVLFPVPPLPLPAAVALFAERARAGGLPLAQADELPGGTVADICRRLDRLPLAVELAAARARHLGVVELGRRLDQRFELLTVAPRTAVARQRTLRAAIDWSYALLEEPERELFTRLAVFEGGFAVEAAEAVGADGITRPTLEALANLVDKSLVVLAPAGTTGETRYHLLETLKQYGLEQLIGTARLAAAQRAHRAYYVAFAAAAGVGLVSSEYRTWWRRVELELPNLRAACDSAIAAGDRDRALRIVSSLWWFWGSTDRHREGRRRLEEALAGPETEIAPPLLALALAVLCYLAGQQLDLPCAIRAGERAVELSAELGDERATATARQSLGLTLETAGEHERSAVLLAKARSVWDAAGLHQQVCGNDIVTCVRALATGDLELVDTTSREVLRRSALIDYEPYRCWAHLIRVRLAEARNDLAAAAGECEHALHSARQVELGHFVSFALTQRARIAILSGDLAGAGATFGEAIETAESAGAGWFAALARVGLADLRSVQGDRSEAVALLRQVVGWDAGPIAGTGRVTLFRRLGGDPVALATAALEPG